jgi:hypothetical protein
MSEVKPQNSEKLFESRIRESGAEVVKSPIKFIPGEVADEFIEVNSKRKGFLKMINRLIEYYNSFYVLDNLGTVQGKWREWKIGIAKTLDAEGKKGDEFIRYLYQSKLTLNMVGGVAGNLGIIKEYLEIEVMDGSFPKEKYEQFMKIYNKIPVEVPYSEMTQDQKMELMELLNDSVLAFLKMFYKTYKVISN